MQQTSPKPRRIVLYLNQFFGQLGGEEVAHLGPRLSTEPVGPARALVSQLTGDEQLVGVVICGDNYFAEQPEQATANILDMVRGLAPDLFLAGPAFNAGRYGVACGALCKAVGEALTIPTVTGMHRENPGVDLYRRDVLILETGDTARRMSDDLARMLHLARRLATGAPSGSAREEGYFSRGVPRPVRSAQPAATRAVDMLLAKVHGEAFQTELELPTFSRATPAPPVADLRRATVALVTDGGLVPLGNPDGIQNHAATKFGVYPISDQEALRAGEYEVSHTGYDSTHVKEDPNRLIPLDIARELEREGQFGRLYGYFLSTTGLANPIENSRRLGREMAEHLRQAGVEAVILTST